MPGAPDAVLPINLAGVRVEELRKAAAAKHVPAPFGTFVKLTLSNLQKGSSNYWCGPQLGPLSSPLQLGVCITPSTCALCRLKSSSEKAPSALPACQRMMQQEAAGRMTDSGATCGRFAFAFVYLATAYVCWLLVQYYQVRASDTSALLLAVPGCAGLGHVAPCTWTQGLLLDPAAWCCALRLPAPRPVRLPVQRGVRRAASGRQAASGTTGPRAAQRYVVLRQHYLVGGESLINEWHALFLAERRRSASESARGAHPARGSAVQLLSALRDRLKAGAPEQPQSAGKVHRACRPMPRAMQTAPRYCHPRHRTARAGLVSIHFNLG